jgi:hypothetical protein
MKTSNFKSSKQYSPKSKQGLGPDCLSATTTCCRYALNTLGTTVVVFGAILLVVYVGIYATGGSMRDRRNAMVETLRQGHVSSSSSHLDVIVLKLDDIQAPFCAQHSPFINFTKQEYQVSKLVCWVVGL